jgi:hypothetical protein
MYNGALAGISLAGDRFFYVNPLESLGTHHRQAWYGCACCPSQICRFLPSIGNYIYGVSDDAVWVHLYIGNRARVKAGSKTITLSQETRYPWDGEVTLKVGTKSPVKKQLRMRIPGWCKSWTLKVNGEALEPAVEKGYAVIDRKWCDGDEVSLDMDMTATLVAADPRVKEDEGYRALQRGPLVYCIEEIDNPEDFGSLAVSEDTRFTESFQEDLLGGVVTISTVSDGPTLNYIPYYAWDNREAGRMRVWVPLK